MNILSFDIEDWFHILNNHSTNNTDDWDRFEIRIHRNVDRILNILEEKKCSGTFFILGWVAKKYPEIVHEICSRGYEIGSHSNMHQLAYDQSKKEFREDISDSIHLLEDIAGKKIRYFRAPGFSITEKNTWCFEILHELGIEVDCSVFPAERAHGGLPSYGFAKPSILAFNGIRLKEFPINVNQVLGKNFVFSGGGYFRLFPYFLIKKWTEKSEYIMSYFHPRDFDPEQPRLQGLSAGRKFKTYVGLDTAENKFLQWLEDFNFIDIGTADNMVDWNKAQVIKLK